jgi:NADH dehydrogenase
MAGQLAELKTEALPTTYPELNPADVRVVLVEMGDALLAPFDDTLRQYAHKELVKRGVDVRLKTAITEVHPDRVDFKDGTTLPVDLVIWAAGVSGSPVLREWGLPIGRGGRIEVNSDLRVIGYENVFALGDASLTVDNPLPQLAQPAIQTGKFAAAQITRLHRGLETDSFKYHNKGTMATIGRGDAVLQMPQGLKLKGVIAWLGWIFLHIVYLLGNRNRAQTLLNLFSRYLLPSRSSAIVGDVMETPKLKAIRK